MRQYLTAVEEVLSKGKRKQNRTGVDTLSTFNLNYEIDLREGFPLLTTKEVSWKNIVVEMLWFMSGRTDIALLQKHACKFWDAWADQEGRVPSAYGNFWRHFPVHGHDDTMLIDTGDYPDHNDQVKWVVEELRRNPMSRRVVVSAWAPGNAQTSALPPCHALWVLNAQCEERFCSKHQQPDWSCETCRSSLTLNLHLTQRSADIALGVPYNIASYALILELMSRFTDIRPGIFAHTLIDAHAYTSKPDGSMAEYDHIPGLQEQLRREPRALPRLSIDPSIRTLDDVSLLLETDTDTIMSKFVLSGYQPHPAIKFKVAV